MKTKIYAREFPALVRIYEQPEFKDMMVWVLFILGFIVSISLLDQNGVISTPNIQYLVIIVVIMLPFFINRFFLQRGSIGGESFRMERSPRGVKFKNEYFHPEHISVKISESDSENYVNRDLFVIISNQQGSRREYVKAEYLLKSDKSQLTEFAKIIEAHLDIRYVLEKY